ncbi:MAG: hypothetical protein DHS80DRAFT_29867 [Piptocephalis tieghemiana]|nr:MAG: hypothetical protein DHS80DRAFT_29867 [Piptocephalis tieghemiana]
MADYGGYQYASATPSLPPTQPDREALWKIVKASPQDFQAWEQLLRVVESADGGLDPATAPSDNIEQCTRAFDAFLDHYPLCFGYWKKYADLSYIMSGNQPAGAKKVFERAVQAFPNSVDLWSAYGSFAIDTMPEDVQGVQAIFERGATSCGLDFLSHPFWDNYISFEEKRGDTVAVARILCRIAHIPMHQYARYFEALNALISTVPLEGLGSPEELEAWANDGSPPEDESAKEAKIRDKAKSTYITHLYPATQAETTKRWVYEAEIKRPYFHVRPLDDAQLANWHAYLDFEEGEGDDLRILALYDRALVACALYDAFWVRFIRWLRSRPSSSPLSQTDRIRDAYSRATRTFIPVERPMLKLQWALYEEAEGDRIDDARDLYSSLSTALPFHLEVHAQWAGFERRVKGWKEGALPILESLLSRATSPPSEGASPPPSKDVCGSISIQVAHLYWRHGRDLEGARTSFTKAIQAYPEVRIVHTAYLAFEMDQLTRLDLPVEKEEEERAGVQEQLERLHAALQHSIQTLKATPSDQAECMEYLLKRYLSFLLDLPSTVGSKGEVMRLVRETDSLLGSLGPYRRKRRAMRIAGGGAGLGVGAAGYQNGYAAATAGGSVNEETRGLKRPAPVVNGGGAGGETGAMGPSGYKANRVMGHGAASPGAAVNGGGGGGGAWSSSSQ